MTIVDAHLHVWDTALLRYPWLDDEPTLGRPFLPGDVEPDVVDKQVFVQADCADGLAEARWVQSLAPGWPQLHGLVAHAPVDEPGLGEVLDELEESPLLVGVRRLLQDEPVELVESAELVAGLRALAGRGLPFDACIRHHQLPALVRTARAVPEVTIVLDHLGKPPVTAGFGSAVAQEWVGNLGELSGAPNVFAKLSGLAPESDPNRPLAEQVDPFLDAALEAFGPGRLLAGSDFPVSAATGHALGYGEWFDLVAQRLSAAEREQVLGGTALAVYRRRG
ncbi:amidohydrolase family protein [Tessaracoccus rhinocerotis]|uniref:Amidohydrolase family protein n=1 Tax=Tessaracoccus rhinocerotis TaxID=1689449 RepID=A0A553K0L4_9ACTN|nr:amidohydrolase family protein [Tessaracoccus rhinocerotis]TRY18243.1 amidohydrolase family protein [Tessaracoccus rhinocerotis]